MKSITFGLVLLVFRSMISSVDRLNTACWLRIWLKMTSSLSPALVSALISATVMDDLWGFGWTGAGVGLATGVFGPAGWA